MPRLNWAESTLADIRGIDAFLTLDDPATAGAALRLIARAAELLRDYLLAGPVLGERTRSLRVKGSPYLIIYAVRGEIVTIVHVHHARQDWRA